MKKIKMTALVSNIDGDLFIQNINGYIDEMQFKGLEVEITYQRYENSHSALIIGRG